MEITEVRVKLMEDSDDRLQAFCSITFDDCFVVRDLKIIEGANGPFVAMPSRKLTSHCHECGCKNHLRSSYCNQCGKRLQDNRVPRDSEGRTKLYADIAHPVNSECREMIQGRVIAEYQTEVERSQQPGYVSRYDDDYELEVDEEPAPEADAAGPPTQAKIEPPVDEPRAPHKPPAAQQPGRQKRPPRSRKNTTQDSSKDSDDFGAGIF